MPKIIVGLMGGSVGKGSASLATSDQVSDFLMSLKRHNVLELDTARVYNSGKSEELLGSVPAKRDFAIATKAPGFVPGSLSYNNVIANCNASLKALGTNSMDLYYFHGPDRKTPLEESCRAIDELHHQGKFDRFGISNFNVAEVRSIHSICKKEGYVLPTAYQGCYNPLTRAVEDELLPTLRNLGMAFYAFSPLAGSFFSKPVDALRNPTLGSRMSEMAVFQSMYINDISLPLLENLTSLCEREGISVKEATLRWIMHHSVLGKDDGVILGGSAEQLEENIKACEKGSLPESIVADYQDMWVKYKEAGKAPPPSV
ncbi:Aldo/keto reductase [Viridothelium virens]|uniref:Aldo/keto reductase n=1 Tax=Viridothelium virens TaxID=1048519 RepID=A0A6A6GXL3_VIRVR|nr:Aldo/keto reductase [Viridothelium virens]